MPGIIRGEAVSSIGLIQTVNLPQAPRYLTIFKQRNSSSCTVTALPGSRWNCWLDCPTKTVVSDWQLAEWRSCCSPIDHCALKMNQKQLFSITLSGKQHRLLNVQLLFTYTIIVIITVGEKITSINEIHLIIFVPFLNWFFFVNSESI